MVRCDNFNKSGDSLSIPTFSKTVKKGTRYNNFSYDLTVFGFFASWMYPWNPKYNVSQAVLLYFAVLL